MGRVYDALKRASATQGGVTKKSNEQKRRNGNSNAARQNGNGNHAFEDSPLFAPLGAAHNSASTAHTEEGVGSALSDVIASRAAGATLDAAGSARAIEFVSRQISTARVEPHLVAITQPRSPYCEQFRALRTRVLQASERRKMQAFVVTSVGVGEGKTLTALNLVWLLAQTDGVRALLIDSDLRRPCATNYLGIDDRKGLSEVLAEEVKLDDCFVRLEPSGLYLLPGGAPRENVAELLSGPKFGRVLAEA